MKDSLGGGNELGELLRALLAVSSTEMVLCVLELGFPAKLWEVMDLSIISLKGRKR